MGNNLEYKAWLDNEYSQWIKALQESTVHNFKEHPQVKRMLGDVSLDLFSVIITEQQCDLIIKIDSIGYSIPTLSGTCLRMIYYAQKVLEQNPPSIVEIGGGVGQFYAIIRALGYTGDYYIFDLPEVKKFQTKYLKEVEKLTGLDLKQKKKFDNCVSFYALGEFDDETKQWYIENVVKKCPHGLIIWNGHSGASNEINFPCTIQDEYPLTGEGNKQLTW